MNKRRNNDDIMSQLGEPLPLPYKLGSEHARNVNIHRDLISSDVLYHKARSVDELEQDPTIETQAQHQTQAQHRTHTQPDIIRDNPDSLHTRGHLTNKPYFPGNEDAVGNQLIKLNRLRPNPIRREYIRRLKDIDMIDSIERKLDNIKQLIHDNKLPSKHLSFLQDIQYQLDLQLNDTDQPDRIQDDSSDQDFLSSYRDPPHVKLSPVMDELERLQKQAALKSPVTQAPDINSSLKPHRIPTINVNKKIIIILILCTIIYLSSSYYVSGLRYEYCYYYC